MPDLMAIVSKAVFEREAPGAKLGGVLPMRVYRSASKHLTKLDDKSRLFLVTVRPPNEALWLVAVLEEPQFDGDQWLAARNRYPVTDLSTVKDSLRFETGKGLAAKPGALGMSLQTPRVLTEADAELILRAAEAARPAPRVPVPRPVNVAKHEENTGLPCLCRGCLASAPETITHGGGTYLRARAEANERLLWFWVPSELQGEVAAAVQAVEQRLKARFKPFPAPGSSSDADKDSEDDAEDDED